MTDYYDRIQVSDERSSAVSKEFKTNPTIKKYLELREEFPEVEIEIAIHGGIDWLIDFSHELEQIEIDRDDFVSCLDADPNSISKYSLHLLKMLSNKQQTEQEGATHLVSRGLAVSDSFVNHLIVVMLDALSWNDELHVPRELIVLIRHQLGAGPDSSWYRKSKSKDLRRASIHVALALKEMGEEVSLRAVAKLLDVNVSTISRMFPEGTLQEETDRLFDSFQSIKNFAKKLQKSRDAMQ